MPPRRRKCRSYSFLLTEEKLLYVITPPLPKKVSSSRQTPLLRFPAKGGKALMRRCRSSSAQRHGCTNCKKRSLCSVFCKTFAYHLCAVKRLRRFFVSAAIPLFFGKAFLSSFGTQTLGIFVCGKREACKKL